MKYNTPFIVIASFICFLIFTLLGSRKAKASTDLPFHNEDVYQNDEDIYQYNDIYDLGPNDA
jgi:hypothetical protein